MIEDPLETDASGAARTLLTSELSKVTTLAQREVTIASRYYFGQSSQQRKMQDAGRNSVKSLWPHESPQPQANAPDINLGNLSGWPLEIVKLEEEDAAAFDESVRYLDTAVTAVSN